MAKKKAETNAQNACPVKQERPTETVKESLERRIKHLREEANLRETQMNRLPLAFLELKVSDLEASGFGFYF